MAANMQPTANIAGVAKPSAMPSTWVSQPRTYPTGERSIAALIRARTAAAPPNRAARSIGTADTKYITGTASPNTITSKNNVIDKTRRIGFLALSTGPSHPAVEVDGPLGSEAPDVRGLPVAVGVLVAVGVVIAVRVRVATVGIGRRVADQQVACLTDQNDRPGDQHAGQTGTLGVGGRHRGLDAIFDPRHDRAPLRPEAIRRQRPQVLGRHSPRCRRDLSDDHPIHDRFVR